MKSPPIYLDHAASTPLDGRVLDAMLPFMTETYGNPASRQHPMGRAAAVAVEKARGQLADLIGADPREIVFTSGATEANNLALKGVAGARAHGRAPRHLVSARTEHHAVLDPLRVLEEQQGFRVSLLGVDQQGQLDLAQLEEVLVSRPLLVSLMHVNNETGTVFPLASISARCRAHGVLFHTDASQSVGKLPVDVNAMGIDALSLSAHKFYGPKGVGALFLRRRGPRVRCAPLLDGGGHEGGRRSGTLNVPGIVGLGAAAEVCGQEMRAQFEQDKERSAFFEGELRGRLEGVTRNGPSSGGAPSILNLSFAGVDAESLMARFESVCASSSSACTSAQFHKSHVLRAMGLAEERVRSSLRFSFGRTTCESELRRAVDEIAQAVGQERGV